MASHPLKPNGARSQNSLGELPPLGSQDGLGEGAEQGRPSLSRLSRTGSEGANSITASSPRKPISATAEVPSDAGTESEVASRRDRHAVPASFSRRYEGVGRTFYLGREVAIVDRGRVLQTPLENKEIIGDMLDVHLERGATSVVLAGSERFRREAWLQATSAGLEVKGYRPTEREAQLSTQSRRELATERQSAPLQQPPDDGWIERRPSPNPLERQEDGRSKLQQDPRPRTGRLLEHGEAHDRFDPRKPLSYFVKIASPEGEVIQWGADLARAMRQSLSGARTGDEVVVRHSGENPISVTRPIRNEQGEVVRKAEVKAWLNQWSVERVDFLRDRARLAQIIRDPSIDSPTALRHRPELKGTYEELDIAQEMAPRLYSDRQDQQRFVTRLRTALAQEIQRGEPLSAPRSRNRSRETQSDDPRTPRQVQERVLS